ncbi:MAG: SMI1/KNR4 family protein [Bryobacteraceae bacterium]
MTQRLSDRWFPFGSNGGDEMLCFDLDSATDQVLWIPFIGMSDKEALLRYKSFEDIAHSIETGAGG